MNFRSLFVLFFTLLFSTVICAHDNNKDRFLVATVADDVISHTIFDAMAEKFAIKIKYVEFDSFSNAVTALENGAVDFMANVTYTEERNQKLDITEPVNTEFVYLFTLHAPDFSKIKKLAMPQGTLFKVAIKEQYPHVDFIEYQDFSSAKQSLLSQQIDGIVGSIFRLKEMSTSGVHAYLDSSHLSMNPASLAAAKGKHSELLKMMASYARSEDFQKHLLSEVKQYQRNLRVLYLRQAVLNSGLNVAKPLNVKLHPFNNQFVTYNNGQVEGISADILNEVCTILQFNCRVTSKASDSFSRLFSSFNRGRVDVFSPLNVTRERQQQYYFSEPYYRQQIIVLKRKNYRNYAYRSLAEMFVERIAIVKSTFLNSMLEDLFPGKEIIQFASEKELVEALLNKNIDYALVSRLTFNDIIRQSNNTLPIDEDKFLGTVYSYDVAFAFQRNEQGEILHRLFNKAMNLVDLEAIKKKYNHVPDWHSNIKVQKDISRLSTAGFAIISIMLLWAIWFFYNKSNIDNLTGLKNRLALSRKYRKAFPKHKALVYLDVNKFKFINDTYGHAMGDKALVTLAELIKKRWQGESYRIGGDEFILVYNPLHSYGEDVLKNIRKFSLYDNASGVEHTVTVSVGCVQNLPQSLPLDEVLTLADQKMYEFKAQQK